MDIKNHAEKREMNPLLGKHPSDLRITCYFAATTATFFLVSDALNPRWRKVFHYVMLALQAGVITHNYKLGLRIKF